MSAATEQAEAFIANERKTWRGMSQAERFRAYLYTSARLSHELALISYDVLDEIERLSKAEKG